MESTVAKLNYIQVVGGAPRLYPHSLFPIWVKVLHGST